MVARIVQIHFDRLCEPKNPAGIPVYAFIASDPDASMILGQEAGLAGQPWSDLLKRPVEWFQEISLMQMDPLFDSESQARFSEGVS